MTDAVADSQAYVGAVQSSVLRDDVDVDAVVAGNDDLQRRLPSR